MNFPLSEEFLIFSFGGTSRDLIRRCRADRERCRMLFVWWCHTARDSSGAGEEVWAGIPGHAGDSDLEATRQGEGRYD